MFLKPYCTCSFGAEQTLAFCVKKKKVSANYFLFIPTVKSLFIDMFCSAIFFFFYNKFDLI